jgi:hypothetical protein
MGARQRPRWVTHAWLGTILVEFRAIHRSDADSAEIEQSFQASRTAAQP